MIRLSTKLTTALGAVLFSFVLGQDPADAQRQDPFAGMDMEALSKIKMVDGFIKRFNDNCGACHGEDLRGAALGTPLIGVELRHGDTVEEIAKSIADGYPENDMPAWSETMRESDIWNLALYVAEQRQGTTILDKRADIPIKIPEGIVKTEKHSFRIEQVARGLDKMPFSIAPLPDGRILLSERMRGLSIISKDGVKSDPITGTPAVYDDSGSFFGQIQGNGWMLDVAIHPNYSENGWIYIHHTDRCSDCNELSRTSKKPVSMNRLIRGRIKNGAWIDEEVIWEADIDAYTTTSDLAAGGRIAFDNQGYVYMSLGMKDSFDFMGVQDLDLPFGKMIRVHDDGRIPEDNPFVNTPGALPGIWTYGHRSSQGLEFNPKTGDLWSTEMGPRGGDELNRLVPGGNYGWPVFTNGVNYDGRPVDVAKSLGLTLTEDEAEFPILDMTPSPALSSFIFYDSPEFSNWSGNILLGTLRATDLLRLEIEDNKVVHKETILTDLARFRDIETGPNGELYILLEHETDSQIIRLIPAQS